MCFSAEASFTTAAVLTTIGFAGLKINFSRSQLFLAMIPLLFAIQQFFEGVLWLGLESTTFPITILMLAKKIFLIFAFLVWPISI